MQKFARKVTTLLVLALNVSTLSAQSDNSAYLVPIINILFSEVEYANSLDPVIPFSPERNHTNATDTVLRAYYVEPITSDTANHNNFVVHRGYTGKQQFLTRQPLRSDS